LSGVLQLIGLVAVAFLVSAAVEHRQRGVVPAGVYILIGVLVGPLGLALLDEDLGPLLRPVSSVCVTWLALLFGFRLRAGALARLGWRGAMAITVETGVVMAVVSVGLHLLLPALKLPIGTLAAVSVGIASAASNRATVRFARTHFHAQGKLTSLFDALTGADDLIPLLAVLALVVVFPGTVVPPLGQAQPWLLAAGTLGLGVGLGAIFALAAGRAPSTERGWMVLLGVTLLGAGVASRLGLPELGVSCVAGVVVAQTAGGRFLAGIVSSTERRVTILLLVLVGASLVPGTEAFVVAGLALGLRLVGKVLVGPLIAPLIGARSDAGLGLLGYGGLALATAAQISLLYGGRTGGLILMAAAVQSVVCDVLGPVALKGVLGRHGELAGPEAASTAVAVASE
jgi:hypothetical protein